MKKKRFTPRQIASILKEYDQGKIVEELTHKHGVSRASFYKWHQWYGGMEASELKKLKALEEEIRKLKQMYSELALDLMVAKYIIEKKALLTCPPFKLNKPKLRISDNKRQLDLVWLIP